MVQLTTVLNKFYDEYKNNTPKKLKLIDSYLVYILLTGILQFVYCVLVGTFPFNSFLSGFISTVSCFVLGGKLCVLSHGLAYLKRDPSPFQYVSGFNQTPRTKASSPESLLKEHLQISSSLTSCFISSWSTSWAKLLDSVLIHSKIL